MRIINPCPLQKTLKKLANSLEVSIEEIVGDTSGKVIIKDIDLGEKYNRLKVIIAEDDENRYTLDKFLISWFWKVILARYLQRNKIIKFDVKFIFDTLNECGLLVRFYKKSFKIDIRYFYIGSKRYASNISTLPGFV